MSRFLLLPSLVLVAIVGLVGCLKTPAIGEVVPYTGATYIGRFADLTSPLPSRCAVSGGSRIRLQFTGTSLALGLWVPRRRYQTEIEWSIDGGAYTRDVIRDGMSLATGLSDTTHTCEVWLAGSQHTDARWKKRYGLAVTGFVVDPGEATAEWPTGNELKMLTIGDSIAEGQLSLGAPDSGSKKTQYADGRHAFGNQLAALIGADNYNFAFAGAGIGKAYAPGATPRLQDAFPYAMRGMARVEPDYDLVLIAAGQNDKTTSSTEFRAGYASLVGQVKASWPFAKVLCMGPLPEWADERADDVRYVADARGCTYVDTSEWDIALPNMSHPDLTGQGKIADHLKPIAASALGLSTSDQ